MRKDQRNATKMIKWMESQPYEEEIKEIDMFILDKRILIGGLDKHFKYLTTCHKEDRETLFSLVPEDRKHDDRFKLQQN